MELSLKQIFLVLGCFTLCSFHSSTANRDPEKQYCGKNKFYCKTDGKCYDRSLRCTSANDCTDSENNCHPYDKKGGLYNYYKKKTPVSSSKSSRKKRSVKDFRHWFVEYRGFVYEFGTYGVQELDINDPNYKYGPGREKVVYQKKIGYSRCTREQVNRFINRWIKANPKYKLLLNNCQDFAKKLLGELGRNCANRRRRSGEENESLKAECPVSSGAVLRLKSNWSLWQPYAFTGLMIVWSIFHMNY